MRLIGRQQPAPGASHRACTGRCSALNRARPSRAGFTLIELVVAIVALAALFAGIAAVFIQAPASSADPQIRAQARAIAEGYMEEILLKAYENPEPGIPESGDVENEGTPPEREERAEYDDVWDYCAIGENDPPTAPDCTGGSESPPQTQNGDDMPGDLDGYEVEVVIEGDHTTPEEATIRVTVSHPSSGKVNYELVSQRADIEP